MHLNYEDILKLRILIARLHLFGNFGLSATLIKPSLKHICVIIYLNNLYVINTLCK